MLSDSKLVDSEAQQGTAQAQAFAVVSRSCRSCSSFDVSARLERGFCSSTTTAARPLPPVVPGRHVRRKSRGVHIPTYMNASTE